MTPDLVYDLLIGAGCAKKLVFSWGGNPGVGSLHRLRDAVEKGWPQPLEIEEHSHADLANAYVAGASGLPFAVLRAYAGSDLPKVNPLIRSVTCPFTGEVLAAVPSVRPDVSVIHAQKADRKGNVLLWGILGVQKEAALAARRCIVTVEEIVDELDAPMNACVLPSWALSAVPGARRRASVLRPRLLRARQPLLPGLGPDRPRPRKLHRVDRRIHPGTEDFGAFQAKLAEGKR